MYSVQNLTLALSIASLLALGAGRDLPPSNTVELRYSSASTADLEARLMAAGLALAGEGEGEGGGGFTDCWNALLELRSCSNEIVLFFINGESYLGLDCCRAIRIITHHCWTSMLSTLGFTPQETDILKGYCDAETADAPPPAPAALPPPPACAPAAAPTPAVAVAVLAAAADGLIV